MSDANPHSPEPLTGARRWASLTASVLVMVGLLAMLRSGLRDWDVRHARYVLLWPGHFLTGLAQLAIGLVGVWCTRTEAAARGFLMVAGLLLVCWAVTGMVRDGHPNDVVTGNAWLVGLHLAIGLSGIAVAARSARLPDRG